MKTALLLLGVLFMNSSFLESKNDTHKGEEIPYQFSGYQPKAGFIPDSITALKIAEAIFIPILGKKEYDSEKPFKAELIHDSLWEIYGTLPPGYLGGTATMLIRKSDCMVVYFAQEK